MPSVKTLRDRLEQLLKQNDSATQTIKKQELKNSLQDSLSDIKPGLVKERINYFENEIIDKNKKHYYSQRKMTDIQTIEKPMQNILPENIQTTIPVQQAKKLPLHPSLIIEPTPTPTSSTSPTAPRPTPVAKKKEPEQQSSPAQTFQLSIYMMSALVMYLSIDKAALFLMYVQAIKIDFDFYRHPYNDNAEQPQEPIYGLKGVSFTASCLMFAAVRSDPSSLPLDRNLLEESITHRKR